MVLVLVTGMSRVSVLQSNMRVIDSLASSCLAVSDKMTDDRHLLFIDFLEKKNIATNMAYFIRVAYSIMATMLHFRVRVEYTVYLHGSPAAVHIQIVISHESKPSAVMALYKYALLTACMSFIFVQAY